MATETQKRAMDLKIERIKQKKPIKMGEIMREAGYSKKSAEYPKRLVESKGWQELLNSIEDSALLKKLNEIALDKKDKRANIEAIKELMKLKDRYPKQKLAISIFEEELKKLE